MALETATYIDGLVSTNPTSSDNVSQGDDHIRLLKATVKATFPNASGPIGIASAGSSGAAIISVTDNTNAALRVTQLGTGNALVVEDSTNPDSTPFVVDASGNVGIGTASPGQKLDVLSSAAAIIRVKGGSSTNQGGAIYVTKAGSTNTLTAFGDRAAIVGGTPDAAAGIYTDSGVPLVFDVSTTERMRIDSSGKVLVGTSSTFIGYSNLQIASSLNEQIAIRSTAAAAGRCWRITADNNNTTYIINQDTVGVYIGNGGTSWSGLSDERAKDIIEPISNAASKVSTLRAVIGKYKTDEEGKRRSFLIAQDVQAVLPEAVSVADQETGYLGLSYTDTIPLLTAALQEALTKIDALEDRIAALEAA